MSEKKKEELFYSTAVTAEYDDTRITDCTRRGLPKGVKSRDGSKKIEVADFTTFNSFFFDKKHGNMKLKIYDYLNDALWYGDLENLIGCEILTERLTADNCRLEELRFWGIDRRSFYTDIKVELMVNTVKGEIFWTGILVCMCGFYPDFCCKIAGLSEQADRKGYIRLSSYLVPVYTTAQVDAAAEKIWELCGMKDARTNPKARNAKELARRMGLKIKYLPIFDHDGINSMVFFSDSELVVGEDVTVKDENGRTTLCREGNPETIIVPANTIVVNTNCVKREYSDINIFHECIHFTKHYLAMRLQELACNDTRKMKMKELTPEEAENYKDPIFFMENQANRGAFGLMMPISDMRGRIYVEMRNVRCYKHRGELFDIVGRRLYKTLDIPEFRIRARMIQLGFVEAAGAMNYVDYKRIQPFAFDKDALSVEIHSYVISSHKLLVLCDTNSDLRELISSGKYIYADGHVVRNTLSYVKKVAEEYYLTDWANANVDLCCLRFTRQYVQNRVGHFVLGRLYLDTEYVKRLSVFLEPFMKKYGTNDEISAQMKYQSDFFQRPFVEVFDEIMHLNGDTRESLSEKLNISKDTLRIYIYNEDMSLDFVVALCLIWKLPYEISRLLLKRTLNDLQDFVHRHVVMKRILKIYWNNGVDKANEILKSNKEKELAFPKTK